jgi:predicted CXXCH cytochrome family protein
MQLKRLMWIALLIAGHVIAGHASAASDNYDHLQSGYELDGAHRTVACESCHVRGVFEGTPRECGFCHDGTGIYAESARSLTHPLTTENCEACHIVANWVAIYIVDHAEVLGACSSCHNGRVAEGLPPGHIQTNQECDACHTDALWNGVLFDHGSITGGCISCHDGRQATGKSATHVLTTEICEDCHTVDFWEPVFTMDHAQVLGSCESCHDGQQATGKHPLHVVSNNQCDDCHTTNAWQPAVFDHGAVAPGTCASCHDGQQATGMNAQHLATSASCDDCHLTIAWIPATFDHDNVAPGSCAGCHDGQTATGMDTGHIQTLQSCDNCHTTDFWAPDTFVHTSPTYPGDHAGNLQCTECHQTNAEQVTWTAPAYQPDCAGCHVNDYESGPHKKHENPDVRYTVSELRDCTGACHIYTDSTLTTINDFRPGPEHSVNQGGF